MRRIQHFLYEDVRNEEAMKELVPTRGSWKGHSERLCEPVDEGTGES